MSLLKRLLGIGSSSDSRGGGEMARLAALLATEIKLYNEKAVEAAAGQARLPEGLAREIARAYQSYTEGVGESEEAESVFCLEVAEALAGGDVGLVKSALEVSGTGGIR